MPNTLLGIMAGLTFGAIAAGSMIPLQFPDKRAAMSAAFIDRFAMGLVIGLVQVAWPGWLVGLSLGALMNLPGAIVTKAHVPIVGLGSVGGLVIGGVIHGWSMHGVWRANQIYGIGADRSMVPRGILLHRLACISSRRTDEHSVLKSPTTRRAQLQVQPTQGGVHVPRHRPPKNCVRLRWTERWAH